MLVFGERIKIGRIRKANIDQPFHHLLKNLEQAVYFLLLVSFSCYFLSNGVPMRVGDAKK